MTEINVCKTIRQKIYVVFYDMKCSKCSNVWIVTSTIKEVSVYFGISKLTLYFPYCFHVPGTVLFTVYFHTVISCFAFSVIDRTRKQTPVNQTIQLCLIKDLPSVQSNVPENEEQHTLSKIIYIKFQNCCFFSLRSILKEVLLKCTQTN